ncbi:MAG: archease [Ignavibacteriae bacterium]|nr:archease [Ignavibacteriota bacterium]
MAESRYRILEHPADVGIEASGVSLKEAFENAAAGLLSIITDVESIDAAEERYIRLTATDFDNLLVKWLSEILYLYDGEDFIVGEVEIESLSPTQLEAIVSGEPYDANKHSTHLDVKAVTYHQLKIQQKKTGCLVRVYLDI